MRSAKKRSGPAGPRAFRRFLSYDVMRQLAKRVLCVQAIPEGFERTTFKECIQHRSIIEIVEALFHVQLLLVID